MATPPASAPAALPDSAAASVAASAEAEAAAAAQRQAAVALELDETKLDAAVTAGQGEVWVLQWLAKAETAIGSIDLPMLQQLQPKLEAALLKLLCVSPPEAEGATPPSTPTPTPSSSRSALPRPGRPARHLLARCLVSVLARTDSRSLFDIVQTLLRTAGDDGTKTRAAPDKEAKAAALYVAGEIFARLGHNVMSLFNELLALTQRLFKNTNAAVLVRFHALLCLSKALASGARSLNDQPAKELLRNLRAGLADRAGAVVRGCAECLLALSQQTDLIATRVEIESLLQAAFKALDTADYVTKRSVARLCAVVLAGTQVENSAPLPESSGKGKKKKKDGAAADASDDDEPPPSSAADGPARTLFTPKAMLEQLSTPYLRTSTSRRGRAAVLDVYATLLTQLGAAWVLANYGVVMRHLADDLPNHARGSGSASSRADVLFLRTGVRLLLRRVIGERMLGEQAQVAALQEISSAYLKRWPVLMPGQHPPSKYSLVLALDECAGLLAQLGSAPPPVLDALYDPLLRCLAHPSHSVQISAAWCLRTLCSIHPTHLEPTIDAVLALLQKDLRSLTTAERGGAELPRRAVGHARGLAALLDVIPRRPLYASFDVSSRIFTLATELLKGSAEHDLPISGVELQVAWTLLGALMSLGPGFVRLHLTQLQTLWRNALPKPAPGAAPRSDAEAGFLLHVRECALGAIYAFLIHNAELLTLDAARRVVALLTNSLAFVDAFAAQHPHLAQEQVPGAERGALSLLDREHMVRRRLLQCFSCLAGSPAMDSLADSLLPAALATFAEPERYVGSAAQAAIAASAGNFSSLWLAADGYAYGCTSLLRDEQAFIAGAPDGKGSYPATQLVTRAEWLNRDSVEVQLDALQRRPVLGAAEHDPLILYARPNEAMSSDTPDSPPLPPPPATGMVDAALHLFAALLPFQARERQISAVETLLAHTRSARLEKNPARRQAVQINACAALLGVLRTATASAGGARRASGFNNERLTTALRDVLKDALLQGDRALRAAASEAYGRLAAIAGSHAMSSQVQFLVDQVVSNRDPDARAGCALAFGAVYSEVGGLSAGPLTKTIVNVLMSLSSDPHPTVHYSALEALRRVVDAASLSYSPFVASTLGMLVKLYMLDTHDAEGGSAGSGNLRADLPAHQAACRVINALIGVLGPDLQDSAKVRALVLTLLHEFGSEGDAGVVVEATKATQHFGLFAAAHLDVAAWIAQLRTHLRSAHRPLKLAAINSFYTLVQRQALVVSRVGGDALVAELFAQLDNDASIDGVREVLTSWLRQTAELSPSSWIDLCQRIMSRVATGGGIEAKAAPAVQQPGALQDEEAAAIDLGDDAAGRGTAQQSRWRTQLFALQCLHEVFLTVRSSGRLEHFDTPAGPRQALLMSSRVGDLIKMAFTASTAGNAAIRLEGLTVLRDVVQNFRLARDPDFNEALLLEQHQAPIAAALTPAFTADSTPEVLAAAVQVCAVFVGSGVVREAERMGRILKLLAAALQSCKDASMQSLGDVQRLSPNATAMLKVAVFTAWGELQVASATQPFLVPVLQPHVAVLAPFWIASLREYARLRTDPDSASLAMPGPGPQLNARIDAQYAGLTRQVLLPHYEGAWWKMLHAVAELIEARDKAILRAMDGLEDADAEAEYSSFRTEPAPNFAVLYGLAFEALAGSEAPQEALRMRVALQSLRSLCAPAFAGNALLEPALFDELLNLARRLVMTEGLRVQSAVVQLLGSVVQHYGARLLDVEPNPDEPLAGEAKLTHCLGVVLHVMTQAYLSAGSADEKVALLRGAYAAYAQLEAAHPRGLHEELLCVALSAYSDMLNDERVEVEVVAPTLPLFKELLERAAHAKREDSDVLPRTLHALLSSALTNVDELRTRAGAAVELKTRNSLLLVAIALSSLPAELAPSAAIVEHYCFLLVQKLHDAGSSDMTGVALSCARSLVLAAAARNTPALRFAVGQLLPGLLALLANQSAVLRDAGDEPDARALRLVDDVVKLLVSFATTAPESQRTRTLLLVLPTLLLLLSPDGAPTAATHSSSAAQLLLIATQAPGPFREATAALDVAQRALLETSVRGALAGVAAARSTPGQTVQKQEAKIALRSFG